MKKWVRKKERGKKYRERERGTVNSEKAKSHNQG